VRLFNLAAALSLVVCVATAVLWPRRYSRTAFASAAIIPQPACRGGIGDTGVTTLRKTSTNGTNVANEGSDLR
jgi:hypothetical protein